MSTSTRFIGFFGFLLLLFLGTLSAYEGIEKKFLLITPEKTGTHLLMKALKLLINKEAMTDWSHSLSDEKLLEELEIADQENCFLVAHLLPEQQSMDLLKALGYQIFFMMRDPRDQVISLLFFLRNKPWQYGPLNPELPFGLLNFDDCLEEAITGLRYGCSAPRSIIGRRIPWMEQDPEWVLPVRFENLVGAEGGGSEELQMEEIRKIVRHIGLTFSDEEINERKASLFGKKGEEGFRSGQIGDWKRYFKPRHIQAFKAVFGDELIYLGYENDKYWK